MRDVIFPDGFVRKPLNQGNYPGAGAADPAGKEIPCMDGTYVKANSFKQVGSISTALTGAGTNQATGAVCPSKTNVFTSVASGTGCKLGVTVIGATTSNLTVGDEIHVINHGANALLVYPPSGGKINNGTGDAALSVAANASVVFKAISTVNLVTF